MTMRANDVVEVLDALEDAGVTVWLDGGWGVDALLGEQTREHDDLDVVADIDHVPKIVVTLGKLGFTTLKTWPDSPESFVLADAADRRFDVHPLRFDSEGNGVQQIERGEWTYPADGFKGRGAVAGRPVRCLTPEVQVLTHGGYELDDDDFADLEALRARFGVELRPYQTRPQA
jgi:lincosamide nucleotidyltransferase A/C/D/E